MVAIRMTLSRGGFGVGAVIAGWSSALLVSVLMRSSVRNGDSGCAPSCLAHSQLSVPAHRAGPQWWLWNLGCGRGGGAVGDGDLDAAGTGAVNRCRPVLPVGLWCGGVGGCAAVVGAASGVTQ